MQIQRQVFDRQTVRSLKERIEKLREYICGEMPKGNGDRWTLLQKERELVRCKDCEHRPTKPDDYDPSASDEGFRLEFPDAVCPAQCEGDGYYSWYPSDNFFCGYGKRKEGADQ